ncbi:Cas1p-domain-containing protein [Auriscalpium vulgare]|uniref:Cas1p-domain-containing protein n=1 Tax=Auriscalpium vulgare TaxID=40419 RepID=A0ACB8S9N4_9AGAM|nr:Cas1p-domain-containing protein [Auriscalpium vulgare]
MVHKYRPDDVTACLHNKSAVFAGDSVTRKLFFQFANIVDPTLPTEPPEEGLKHSDHSLRSNSGSELSFIWDPFLNSSRTADLVSPYNAPAGEPSIHRPGLLVLGSGLWYLRYADTSGGLTAWESNIEFVLNSLIHAPRKPADEVVFLPVEDVVSSKLSPERATTMLASDRDAMNSDLYHRIHPYTPGVFDFIFSPPAAPPVSLFKSFNDLLDPSQTEDGLHFSDAVVRTQANVLLNFRCNEYLPKQFPLDKTCCRSYPRPSYLHLAVLAVAILSGPYLWLLSRYPGSEKLSTSTLDHVHRALLIFSGAIALIFVADRTSFWMKEQKQFNPWTFAFLSIASLVVGLATVRRADQDLGFLNRVQTDEWKGWMQIAILIYHYLGASKISGIYNPIRVLVASYLFMTGYGHTTFYVKKADFSFNRVAQIMIRLNLFTLILAYAMNTDYISYYFAPLVSMWYLIIYTTMIAFSRFNDRMPFLVGKILLSAGLVTWFMHEPWLLETCFDFLNSTFNIQWSAKEWAFRVGLDLWIVYVGMFAALAVIKFREHRLADHPSWPLALKIVIGASCLVLLWFFAFELMQPDKFVYNTWHPYISFLPVVAFVTLRNANPILRSASSHAFAWIGRCSLETFTIQYHLWLAADTKGILLVIPWTQWRSLNMVITTVMFLYVSHYVAIATGDLTKWICGKGDAMKTLPTTVTDIPAASSRHDRDSDYVRVEQTGTADEIVEIGTGQMAGLGVEPPTPTRPRWVDRLADGSRPQSALRTWFGKTGWSPGVGTKLVVGLFVMWALNVCWPPSETI